jgi:hypothetical protein
MEDIKKIIEDLDSVRARLNMYNAQENLGVSEDLLRAAESAHYSITEAWGDLSAAENDYKDPQS